MFLIIIMIMFQARGRWRKVVQRSHPFGAGTASVSKRSSFLCNLSLFMFIFLAIYSYSCLETMSMRLFFRSGRTLRKSMRSSWSSGATSGRASFKKVKQISPHCCSRSFVLWQSLCRSGSRIQSGCTCWRHFNPHTLRSFWVVGGIGKSRRWL